jgi:hypothetical protein
LTKQKTLETKTDEEEKIWLELAEVEKFLSHITGMLMRLAESITLTLESVKKEVAKGEHNNDDNKE